MQTCLRLGLTVSDEILYYNTLYIGQLQTNQKYKAVAPHFLLIVYLMNDETYGHVYSLERSCQYCVPFCRIL